MNLYLNGQFVPPESANVSVLDRGFLFGDGVYEVIPVYRRRPFYLDRHLDRLQKSLDGIRMKNPHSRQGWADIVEQLIAQNDADDQYLYLQVTRGVMAKRDHAFSADLTPTVLGITNALPTIPEDYLKDGVAAITQKDIRWANCHLKTTALLPNTLLRQAAVDAGAMEAILLCNGVVTEGAASNIVIVHRKTIISPVRDRRMLHGVTLDVVEQLAERHCIPMVFRDVTEAELRRFAEEVWLLASTKEVIPITRIDKCPVGDGVPGPMFKRMHDYYQAHKRELSDG